MDELKIEAPLESLELVLVRHMNDAAIPLSIHLTYPERVCISLDE